MAKHASSSITLLFMVIVSFATVVHSLDDKRSNKPCLFFTQVYTAPEFGAGTDARVTLKLFLNNSGSTPYIATNNLAQYGDRGPTYDYFKDGAGNNFNIRSPHPCPLPPGVCKIQLSHDNSGTSPSWRVLVVRVTAFTPVDPPEMKLPAVGHVLKQRYDFVIQEVITAGMTVTRDLCPKPTTTTTLDTIRLAVSVD